MQLLHFLSLQEQNRVQYTKLMMGTHRFVENTKVTGIDEEDFQNPGGGGGFSFIINCVQSQVTSCYLLARNTWASFVP